MPGSITKRELEKTDATGRTRKEPRYDVTWDAPSSNGKRKQHKRTFRTRKDAERFQVEVAHQLQEGSFVAPSKQSLAEFLQEWLAMIAPPKTKWGTFVSYEGIVRNHWIRLLGCIRVAQLTKLDVEQAHRIMIDEGVAASTLRTRQAVLTRALTWGLDHQRVRSNVASRVEMPDLDERELVTWTAAQIRRFEEANADDPRLCLWRVFIDSGMRSCEVLALAWKDVDWERGTVQVRRKLVRGDGGRGLALKDGTKTRAGRRTIVLTRETMRRLRAQRNEVVERKLQLGPEWKDHDLVFPRHDGEPQRMQAVREAFERAVKRAELERITPHGMRHTMATLLAEADVHPMKISDRLGHVDYTMALKRYTRVSHDMRRDTADTLEKAFADGPEDSVTSA